MMHGPELNSGYTLSTLPSVPQLETSVQVPIVAVAFSVLEYAKHDCSNALMVPPTDVPPGGSAQRLNSV